LLETLLVCLYFFRGVMSSLSAEERTAQEQQLRSLAQQLRDLSTTTAGEGHEDAIGGFASQAESYADRIRDAPSLAAAAELVQEVTRKQGQWTQLLELLSLAGQIENDEEAGADVANEVLQQAVQEAEAKLRSTATQLRAVADSGTTAVFGAIGTVAAEAETGLEEFLAAESAEEKLQVYTRVEESRARWLSQMETLHTTVAEADGAESEAPTDAPDAGDQALEEFVEDTACKAVKELVSSSDGCTLASGAGSGYGSGYNNYFPAAGCSLLPSSASGGCTAVSSPTVATGPAPAEVVPALLAEVANISPKEAREKLVVYLNDKDEGLLATLRTAVAKVKEDDRFEGVHEDAGKLLEQMELAVGAIIPEALTQDFSDDLAGAEDKLKATVEPMRKAQWGGFYAKKAAFTVRKYDLYVAKGKMPKLKNEHADLLECATVIVDLAEFLRKEAQNAIMDSVTGLVSQTTR